MKKILLLVMVLSFAPFHLVFAGNEGVHGGDEVGIEFLNSLRSALVNMQRNLPELYKSVEALNLENVALSARTVVTDKALVAVFEGVMQSSVAVNDPARNLIVVNRARWQQIVDARIREAIALHEVLSLKKLEDTGNYKISSRYAAGENSKAVQSLTADVAPGFLDAVVVPVPGEIQDSSSFTISSPGPNREYKICAYSITAGGQTIFHSGNTCTRHYFNEQVKLPPGNYIASLNESAVELFSLRKNEKRIFPLAKLEVPKIDGTFKFELFLDVSVKAEQDKILRALWIQNENALFIVSGAGTSTIDKEEYCHTFSGADVAGAKICRAIRQNRYQDIAGVYLRFRSDAHLSHLSEEWKSVSNPMTLGFDNVLVGKYRDEKLPVGEMPRWDIADGYDGQTVYVFPGTYGIRFTSSGGHATENLGIVVK